MYPNNFRVAGDPRPYWSACYICNRHKTLLLKVIYLVIYLNSHLRKYQNRFTAYLGIWPFNVLGFNMLLCCGVMHMNFIHHPSKQVKIIGSNFLNKYVVLFDRKLPELTLEDFKNIPLQENIYKWIHFEVSARSSSSHTIVLPILWCPFVLIITQVRDKAVRLIPANKPESLIRKHTCSPKTDKFSNI